MGSRPPPGTNGKPRIQTQICLSLEPEFSAAKLFLRAELSFRGVNAVAVSYRNGLRRERQEAVAQVGSRLTPKLHVPVILHGHLMKS